ncbi:hypothetical protein [Eoetvoesiella caeni]
MYNFPNLIDTWDQSVLHLRDQGPDLNVSEFDYSLWALVHQTGTQAPDLIRDSFDLTLETIEFIVSRPIEDMELLASGTMLSFTMVADESNFLKILGRRDYNKLVFLSRDDHHEYDAAYWLLMNRQASKDLMRTTQIFGVGVDLARAVANATDTQLRHLAITSQAKFVLRFDQALIPQILENSNVLSNAHLKRVVQSMRNRGGRAL